MDTTASCDIEIFERRYGDLTDLPISGLPIRPNGVRINGIEMLIPDDTKIEISPISGKDLVRVTITLFPTSLHILPNE